jgi:hypothetical protein
MGMASWILFEGLVAIQKIWQQGRCYIRYHEVAPGSQGAHSDKQMVGIA